MGIVRMALEKSVQQARLKGVNGLAKEWLGQVEGLRGIAALWVFAFHVGIVSGTSLPIISAGGRGVDLFILISGFIMAHHFLRRKEIEPWSSPQTFWRFWVRRFFRIAPLYYLLLILSLVFHRTSDAARDVINSRFPESMTARHSLPSLSNCLTHLTFVFGVLPHFASATPLPDWSIGLEVQFYLVFPFLMLSILRFDHQKTIVAVSLAAMFLALLFPSYFRAFTMPALLPLRIYLFGMGMLIAARMHSATGRIWPLLVALPTAAHFMLPGVSWKLTICQISLALFFYGMTAGHNSRLASVEIPIRKFLSHRIIQQLGLISYSLYLVHMLIVFPVTAFIVKLDGFASFPPLIRFLTALAINGFVVIPISVVIYAVVEKPGVQLGKRLVELLLPQPSLAQHLVAFNE